MNSKIKHDQDICAEAVGYIRVSTTMQSETGHSLDAQENLVKDYCERNALVLKCIYREEGLSGTILNRPKLNEMIDNLESNQRVVFANLSRLTRISEHLHNIYKRIIEKNCKPVFLDLNIDVTEPLGKCMMSIIGTLAELERDQISSRISLTMSDMSRRGTLVRKPCFGWIRNPDKADDANIYIPDKKKQAIIKDIHQLLLDGISNRSKMCKEIQKKHKSKMLPQSLNNIVFRYNLEYLQNTKDLYYP